MSYSFPQILIGVASAICLCALVIVFIAWSRELDDLAAELPHDPGARLLRSLQGTPVPWLLVTVPALGAWRIAAWLLPPSFQAPWWGALIVAYAAAWLLLYAVLEHKWRNHSQSPDTQARSADDAGDATSR